MSSSGRRAFLATLAGGVAVAGLYGLRGLLRPHSRVSESATARKLIPAEALAQPLPSRDEFAGQLHTHFSLQSASASLLDMELIEVSEAKRQPALGGELETFSICFKGPQSAAAEGIFILKHAQLGTCDVFLTRVGNPRKTTTYQAVFTRFV